MSYHRLEKFQLNDIIRYIDLYIHQIINSIINSFLYNDIFKIYIDSLCNLYINM